ncbi:MAG: hypothetical protein CMP20_02625 [Rickettsiales bacterium]|nr:hypothetical protein [Rickettsiales bacterium]
MADPKGFVTDSEDEEYGWLLIEEKRERENDDSGEGSSEKRQRGLNDIEPMEVAPQGTALAVERLNDLETQLVAAGVFESGYEEFKIEGLGPSALKPIELDDVPSMYAALYNEYLRLRRLIIGNQLYDKLGSDSKHQVYYQKIANYRLGKTNKRTYIKKTADLETLVFFLSKDYETYEEKGGDTELYNDELRRLRDLLSFSTTKAGESFEQYFTEIDNYYTGNVFDLTSLPVSSRDSIDTPVDEDSPANVQWYFSAYKRFLRLYSYIYRRFVAKGRLRYSKSFTRFARAISEEQAYIATQTFVKRLLRPTLTFKEALPARQVLFLTADFRGNFGRIVLLRFFQAFDIQLKGLDLENDDQTENIYKTAERLAKLLVTIPAIESPYKRFETLTEELEKTQQAREYYTKGFLPARTKNQNRLFFLAADQNPQQDQADLLYAKEYLNLVYQLIPPGFDFDPLVLMPAQREALARFLFKGQIDDSLYRTFSRITLDDDERAELDKADVFRTRFRAFSPQLYFGYSRAVDEMSYSQRVSDIWAFQAFEQFADIVDQSTDYYGILIQKIVRGRALPRQLPTVAEEDPMRFYMVGSLFTYLTGRNLLSLGLAFEQIEQVISPGDFFIAKTIYNQMVRKRVYNEEPINQWVLPESVRQFSTIATLFDKLVSIITPSEPAQPDFQSFLDDLFVGVQIPRVLEGIVQQNGEKILVYVATLKQVASSDEEKADLAYLAKMLGIDLETLEASYDQTYPSYVLNVPVVTANKAYDYNRLHLIERINAFMMKPVKDFIAESVDVGPTLEREQLERVRNINRKLFYGLLFETSVISEALSEPVLGIETLEEAYFAVYERFAQ